LVSYRKTQRFPFEKEVRFAPSDPQEKWGRPTKKSENRKKMWNQHNDDSISIDVNNVCYTLVYRFCGC